MLDKGLLLEVSTVQQCLSWVAPGWREGEGGVGGDGAIEGVNRAQIVGECLSISSTTARLRKYHAFNHIYRMIA